MSTTECASKHIQAIIDEHRTMGCSAARRDALRIELFEFFVHELKQEGVPCDNISA